MQAYMGISSQYVFEITIIHALVTSNVVHDLWFFNMVTTTNHNVVRFMGF